MLHLWAPTFKVLDN
jgi:hypothetical protein